MVTTAELVSSVRCFGGLQNVYKHRSNVLDCDMQFGAYIPDHEKGKLLPGLFYLSGLTCTHANFMEKSGFQRYASKYGKQFIDSSSILVFYKDDPFMDLHMADGLGLIVVNPDTSPRGVNVPGDEESYDIGKGAGFYVDATEQPWSSHYKMYSYVVKELPEIVKSQLPIDAHRIGVFGHSMGGHGAITVGLRNPDLFKSISAFAPICHPINCPFGKKAFSKYLGENSKAWELYDSSVILQSYDGPPRKILVDQGTSDEFLSGGELQPESLKSHGKVTVEMRMQPDYGHSYYFIATFMEDHFKHHAEQLKQ